MEYNNLSHIKNLADVVVFFEHLLYERKLSFHPDDDFAVYINMKSGVSAFNNEEVRIYNRLMDECFDVCDKTDTDIYTIGLKSMKKLIDTTVDESADVGELVRVKGDSTIYKVISIDDNQSYNLASIDGIGTLFTTIEANVVAI